MILVSGLTSKEASILEPSGVLAGPLRWKNRPEVENDDSCVQLIPYGVLVALVDSQWKALVYNRAKVETEERLHDKYSIGAGGHVQFEDREPAASDIYTGENRWQFYERTLRNCLTREVYEEFGVYYNDIVNLVGPEGLLSVDFGEQVDRHHVGFLYYVLISDYRKVKTSFDFCWHGIEELRSLKDAVNFENWSKLAIDMMFQEKILG